MSARRLDKIIDSQAALVSKGYTLGFNEGYRLGVSDGVKAMIESQKPATAPEELEKVEKSEKKTRAKKSKKA